MRFCANLIFCVFLFGCGYQPAANLTRNLLGENIYVAVSVSKTDPQNSVAIQDGVKDALIKRLGKNITDKQNADVIITARISSLSFSPISTDTYGYTTAYRVVLGIDYVVEFSDGRVKSVATSGDYDFTISRKIKGSSYTDSVISDSERFNAIKNASDQTFDEFISKLAIEGIKNV